MLRELWYNSFKNNKWILLVSLTTLRIATRKSPLAMRQTEMVKAQLLAINPALDIQLLPFQTKGDTFLNQSLSKIGGKGLFVKELETALLENKADLAVHSMKDMPYELPIGLGIHAILKREDPRDALISNQGKTFLELPAGSRIGTSSLRRACQLLSLRNDLEITPLRGNINTRLNKRHEFDAIVLAAAGLIRMDFEHEITHYLAPSELLPAAGQGALGIECRNQDTELKALLSQLTCLKTQRCVLAERMVIKRLQGSCQVPLAAFATLKEDELFLHALVGRHDGSEILTANGSSSTLSPEELGQEIANKLIEKGVQVILNDYI